MLLNFDFAIIDFSIALVVFSIVSSKFIVFIQALKKVIIHNRAIGNIKIISNPILPKILI